MPAFFITEQDICDRVVTIGGALHHHLSHSLRLKPGDTLLLTEAGVRRHRARVTTIDRTRLQATIQDSQPRPPRETRPLHLALAILKHDPMDWVIQKATELGVASVQPLITHRSAVRPEPDRASAQRDRWQRIAREAAQQSEQWTIPSIHVPLSLEHWLRPTPLRGQGLVLQERAGAPSLPDVRWASIPTDITVVVGPEGGWEAQELKALEQRGYQGASLGAPILRAETAALAAISIVQAHLGHFR